jgi:hypothetical protein
MSQRRDEGAVHGEFERKGGYPSPATPVPVLPKVPAGPAPGVPQSGTCPEPAAEPAETPTG